MRPAALIAIKLWGPTMTGRIVFGETPLALVEAYSEYAGRMRPLPDWAHQGAILGLMGGTEVVRGKLASAKNAGVPVAGLWLQDWVGTRRTSAGTQLWWNWVLDEQYYPAGGSYSTTSPRMVCGLSSTSIRSWPMMLATISCSRKRRRRGTWFRRRMARRT
jgi:alpha-glucosidase (family GH31 glycosyl hydrolase)